MVVKITKVVGCILSLGTVVGLFLEAVSANYTLTDLPLANRLLTASYTIWTVVYGASGMSVAVTGNKLQRIIQVSVDFLKTDGQHGDIKDRLELEKCLSQLKSTSRTIIQSMLSSSPLLLIMAFLRYYVWTSEGWSLFLLSLFVFSVGFSTFFGILLVTYFDLRLLLRKSGGSKKGSSSEMTSSSDQK